MRQNTLNNNSNLKMGAACVIITGICYFIISICALFSPKPIASYVSSNAYFVDFEKYKYYFILLKYLMCVANATMIGVVISIYDLMTKNKKGWFFLLTILSIVGLGIGMQQSVLDATQIPHLALQYEKATPIIQHVMIAFGVSDPAIYMLSLGIPGIWLISANLLLYREFSLFLALCGILWGLGCIITVVAHLFVIVSLLYLIAAGALIGVPLWTVFQARFFLKKL